MSTFILCADATSHIGTGHVMRCIALAQAITTAGHEACMLARVSVPWVQQRLRKENITIAYREGIPAVHEDPALLLQDIRNVAREAPPDQTWVVLDGYHFDPECHKTILADGFRLLIIDDYNHLPEYHCHVLLNQNIDAHQYKYHGSIKKLLLGPDFTLLRQEFVKDRSTRVLPSEQNFLKTILISLGGGNFIEQLTSIAKNFASPEWQNFIIRIVLGGMEATEVMPLFASCPGKVELLHTVNDMAALLQETDICITAGGSTCWELCCLGVPFCVVAVADNQKNLTNFLIEQKMALSGAQSDLSQNLYALMNDVTLYTRLKKNIQMLVDGNGAARVVHKMAPTTSHNITLREVEENDISFVHMIANDPVTRSMSFQQHHITIEEHSIWFEKQIKQKLPFYIALFDGIPCGYVRFDTSEGDATISISIAPRFRKLGLGHYILDEACKAAYMTTNICSIHAYTKNTNYSSINIFTKASFVQIPYKDASIVHLFHKKTN